MAALLLTASNPRRPAGQLAFASTPGGRARDLAFAIPDVPWYESSSVGWAVNAYLPLEVSRACSLSSHGGQFFLPATVVFTPASLSDMGQSDP